jgi:hypothetical protein
MKHKSQPFSFVIATLLVAVAQFVVTPLAAAETRPFKGRIDGTFIGTPTENPAIFQTVARAVGQATHAGAFTKVTSDVLNIVTGEVEGAFTMTTSNGDLLTGRYAGFVLPGATPGTFSWLLQSTITGGTGRFFHATGEFVFIAEGNYVITDGVLQGDYTETFDGTINY